ncbi:MAG: 1-acyl-sn-glycerol-3-phosphate acyltransferase [Clostridia bacterium]|nr:1-acyl-sn-glycerol-3-phosphate acyltransferase [Clostridia bacterium]
MRTFIWFCYFWLSLLGTIPSLRKVERMTADDQAEARNQLIDDVATRWSSNLLSLAGCQVTVIGEEHIPKDQTVLFVGNHQSNFDIPILLTYIKGTKGFIAKKELEKMPIINQWMRAINCVFMDRDNLRQSAIAINQGIKFLKAGTSMVVFPEGTRSRDGEPLEFKQGALKLATKSGVPVVPVTIKGSVDIMASGSLKIKPAKVEVIFSPPIDSKDYPEKETLRITEDVKNIIVSKL